MPCGRSWSASRRRRTPTTRATFRRSPHGQSQPRRPRLPLRGLRSRRLPDPASLRRFWAIVPAAPLPWHPLLPLPLHLLRRRPPLPRLLFRPVLRPRSRLLLCPRRRAASFRCPARVPASSRRRPRLPSRAAPPRAPWSARLQPSRPRRRFLVALRFRPRSWWPHRSSRPRLRLLLSPQPLPLLPRLPLLLPLRLRHNLPLLLLWSRLQPRRPKRPRRLRPDLPSAASLCRRPAHGPSIPRLRRFQARLRAAVPSSSVHARVRDPVQAPPSAEGLQAPVLPWAEVRAWLPERAVRCTPRVPALPAAQAERRVPASPPAAHAPDSRHAQALARVPAEHRAHLAPHPDRVRFPEACVQRVPASVAAVSVTRR
jgi:hypothetical protein